MKIGVFDSGVGGLLIAQKIQQKIPNATVEFLCDHEYFPYGNKPKDVIANRVEHFLRQFVQKNCSMVVLACNSATTTTMSLMRQKFPLLHLVGIEPPIRPVSLLSKKKKIALLGTEATIQSDQFAHLIKLYGKNCVVHGIACSGLAQAIETWISTKRADYRQQAIDLFSNYVNIAVSHDVDVIGLACTHYPYLMDEMMGLYPDITFYDPTDAVVKRVASVARLTM